MRLHTGFEEIERFRAVAVGSHFLAACVVQLRHLADEGNNVAEEFHQSAHSHILACANAEHGEYTACDKSLSNTFAHFVLSESFFFEEFLHQSFIVLCCCLHEGFVKFHGFVHLLGGDVFDGGDSALGLPAEFLHEQYIDERVESWASFKRVLNLYALAAIDILHAVDDVVEVALFTVELINKENDRLFQFFGIAKVVLRTHFRTVLAIDEDDSLVGDIERSDGAPNEIVGSRAVYNVEFLVVPFHMEYCWEDRVSIFQLNREIVAHGVLCLHASAALDDTGFVKHTFGKCGLAAARTAEQCDVLNFVCLIYFHINRF